MAESSVDLHELEKLSPNIKLTRTRDDKEVKDPEKWQMILEPALVGSMLAINIGMTSLQNFYLRTACTVDLQLDPSICDKGVGAEFREAEEQSQAVLSNVNISRSFVGSLISTVVLLFIGPWSDCSGRRKPLMILPLIGMVVMTSGVLLMLTFPGASTVTVLYVVQIPMSLGGNFGLLLAAVFSYIGDVCHATGRDVTRVMGTHRAAIQIAHVAGAILGPLLYNYLGFYGVFPLVLFLQLSSLLYIIIYLKDININTENKVSVLNWKLPFNAIQCLVRRRDGNKRAIILLMVIVSLGDKIILTGEVFYSYLYYRLKFAWNDIMFGSFLAYRNIVSFLGTIMILSVLKRRLRLSDEIVGALAACSYILATSGLIVATYTICVFMLPLFGIISQGSQVVQRPLVNRQILPTEQGKIYSVLGALESAMQTITTPLYSLLYSKTVSTVPDAWLFPGLVLAVLQILSYLYSRRLSLNMKQADPAKENVELDKSDQLRSKEINGDTKITNTGDSNHSNIYLSPETVDNKSQP